MVKEEVLLVTPTTSQDLGEAFSVLRVSLCNYLRRRVSDPALIEDLVQDVFVKASAAIGDNRAPRNLVGWLYAAARTTVIDYYRSARPDIVELDENLPDAQLANDELLHQQLATCLRPFTQQLPAIYRDTLFATDFEGKTMRTLAEEQGVSLSAIKSRASRARLMLKAKLLECCHVEISNGIVTDYSRQSSSSCGDGCV